MATLCADAEVPDVGGGFPGMNDIQSDFAMSNMAVPIGLNELACISFDHQENLLWAVDVTGHVISYYRAALHVYTKFFWPMDSEDVCAHSVIPTQDCILIIGKFTIAAFTRGGVPVYFYRSEILTDISCAHFDPHTNLLFLGGQQSTILVYDTEMRSERSQIALKEETAVIIRTTDRFLVSASEDGKLTVRTKDLINFNVVVQTEAHSSCVTDFDVFGTYLVCCGKSVKTNGQVVFDNFLKVYDVRNLNAQAPIGFNRQPTQCRFIGLDAKLVVVSGNMLFMVNILDNKVNAFGTLPLPATDICFSDTHQIIAAAISGLPPMVQIFWTDDGDPPFTAYDVDPVLPLEEENLTEPLPFDTPISLASFPVAYKENMSYCSDMWSGDLIRTRYLKYTVTPDIQEKFNQNVSYVKSPYANTRVAGFNVWTFDDDDDPVVQRKRQNLRKRSPSDFDDHPSSNGLLIGPTQKIRVLDAQPDPIQHLSTQIQHTSLMSKFQDAPEFVPGRAHHTANSTLAERRLTPEPRPSRPAAAAAATPEKSASNRSLDRPEPPRPDRLPNMSFDQLRELAAEMRKRKEEAEGAEAS